MALLGVALLAVLFLVLNFALVIRHWSLTGFLTVAPLALAPLIATPLVHLTGIADHPFLYVVPTTGAADVLRSGLDPAALSYLVLAIAAAAWLARRRFTHDLPAPTGRPNSAATDPDHIRVAGFPRWWTSTAAPRCAAHWVPNPGL
jgi:fluoroquinolone transport system permease protein